MREGRRGGLRPVPAALQRATQGEDLRADERTFRGGKGGVEVQVSGARAFCPISQLDLRHVEDASVYVGQKLQFKITRFEEGGRSLNLVLSRRALLEEENAKRAAELKGKLEGLRDGELKGLRDALLRLIARAGLPLSEDDRARILACDDAPTLDRWIENIIGAKAITDVLC